MKFVLPFVYDVEAENQNVAQGIARSIVLKELGQRIDGKAGKLEVRCVERLPDNQIV